MGEQQALNMFVLQAVDILNLYNFATTAIIKLLLYRKCLVTISYVCGCIFVREFALTERAAFLCIIY